MNIRKKHPASLHGFTLIEVMIATLVLALVGSALLSLFIQNHRIAKIQSYRTQAVTTSLSLTEQIRFLQYPQINTVHAAGAAGTFTLELADPSTPSGYRDIALQVNALDGTTVNPTWTSLDVVVEGDPNTPRLPMRFFLDLRRNRATTGTLIDVFEVAIVYQWRRVGRGNSEWMSGDTRLVVPNLNPML